MKHIAALILALISLTFFIGANCDSGDTQTSYFFCCDSNNPPTFCTTDPTKCPAGGCTTGSQVFTNGQNECNILQSDSANNNCDINDRVNWYINIGCSGTFNENPPMAPPTNVTATAGLPGSDTIFLTWTAPVPNLNDGPLTYNIYRGTASGGEGLLYQGTIGQPFPTGTTFQDTAISGLQTGITYYYEVSAVNLAGGSGTSLEAPAPGVGVVAP